MSELERLLLIFGLMGLYRLILFFLQKKIGYMDCSENLFHWRQKQGIFFLHICITSAPTLFLWKILSNNLTWIQSLEQNDYLYLSCFMGISILFFILSGIIIEKLLIKFNADYKDWRTPSLLG